MWHFVVIQIEYAQAYLVQTLTKNAIDNSVIEKAKKHGSIVYEPVPCWNILYKAPIEDRRLNDEELEYVVFLGCQAWIEQSKVEGSKYAIMKMYIV
jgi:hypothetical protein